MTARAKNNTVVAVLVVIVSVSKTINDYASKIKSATLSVNEKEYNWTTALPDAIIFLLFSGTMLTWQYCRGQVTQDEFRYIFRCNWSWKWKELGAWKYLIFAGLSDVADLLTGLAAQPHLSTFMYALANQATGLFTAFFSVLLIGTRYTAQEVVSLVCIVAAALLGVKVSITEAGSIDSSSANWAIFAAITTSFAALGFVIKELMFLGYQQFSTRHQVLQQPVLSDKNLSVFVVSTGVALVGVMVSVPMALVQQALLEGSFATAWTDLQDGLHQLVYGDHALFAYSMYVMCNITFNVALLLLTSYGSALMAFLSIKLAVPMIAILSPLPWPIIGPSPVTSSIWFILVVMLVAIAAFRHGTMKREELKVNTCCWPLRGPARPDAAEPLGTSLCPNAGSASD